MVCVHEVSHNPKDLADAVAFIEAFGESNATAILTRYEVGVRYTNGDEIRGQFKDKSAAVAFLRGMR